MTKRSGPGTILLALRALPLLVLLSACERTSRLPDGARNPGPRAREAARSRLDSLRGEIVRLNREMEAAFARGDMLAVARLYADDARIVGPRNFEVRGRTAIDTYWKGLRDPRSWKLDVLEVGGSMDDAYQVGRSTLVHGPAGAERTSLVDFVVIWRRQPDGTLRIVLDFFH